MTYETVRVDIFETTAELWLDGWRMKGTEPMYAAMIPGSDRYYCFAEKLESLPKELARVAGSGNRVVPVNLNQPGHFKNMKFGDSEQAVTVHHEPLSPSKLEDFISAAIQEIAFSHEELRRIDNEKRIGAGGCWQSYDNKNSEEKENK
ncbi:MAG: hypothetical protein Q8R47_00685 [Nanoarchaeota archaeon]|nr:hypothetical protein [Nanoarchaeota archaeon]